jgi:GMP synthase-like glutamine amidotransferase
MANKSNYRIHFIQHVPFEGLGYIGTWIDENNFTLSTTKMYEDYEFPDLSEFDLLIIMGGPMGTYEEDKYPWLKEEKAFVKEAINADKAVVGICLGSQIIASALGAKVYPNKEKEIGWLPVTFSGTGSQALFTSKDKSPIVFQWHGDTFDLPVNATLLASSEACKNQAFLYKDNVLALQFHLEVTEKSYAEILDNSLGKLTDGKYIQTENYIRSNTHYIEECNRMIKSVMDKLIENI